MAQIAEKEGVEYEEEALHLIAQKADGALRDGLSIFDLIVTYSLGKAITYKATIDNLHILDYEYYFQITDAILSENASSLLLVFDEILAKGFDGHNFIIGLCEHFRNLMVCKDEATLKLLEVSENTKQKYKEQAKNAGTSLLMSALSIANQCDTQYKSSKNTRLHVELALLKMAYLHQAIQLARSAEEAKKKSDNGSLNPTAPANQVAEKKNDIKQAPVRSTFKLPTLESISERIVEKPKEPTTPQPNAASLTTETRTLVQTQVEEAWSELAIRKEKEGKINEHLVLHNRHLKVQGNVIHFSVDNAFQADYLAVFKTELVEHLREKLGHHTLYVEYTIEKKENKVIKAYTPTEKYQYLVQKYPALSELKQKLGLDLDF